MSACYTSSTRSEAEEFSGESSATHRILVAVSDELLAAVEGWRQVHGVEQSEAIGTLVRLGLLSEIAKIYRLVSDKRQAEDGVARKPRRQGAQRGADAAHSSLAR